MAFILLSPLPEDGLVLVLNAVDAGSVQISTNGAARARITSTGLLGIGTTTPTSNVDIAVTAPTLNLRSTAATSHDAIFRMRGARTSGGNDLNQIIFETNDTGGGYNAGSRLGSIIGGKTTSRNEFIIKTIFDPFTGETSKVKVAVKTKNSRKGETVFRRLWTLG